MEFKRVSVFGCILETIVAPLGDSVVGSDGLGHGPSPSARPAGDKTGSNILVADVGRTKEAVSKGRRCHTRAFPYFAGVPRTILYDNTRLAVKEIAGDGERKPTEAFSEVQSHYLFAAKFGRP
jgi:hypothetical protein